MHQTPAQTPARTPSRPRRQEPEPPERDILAKIVRAVVALCIGGGGALILLFLLALILSQFMG
ncbi:hypothetical protein GCM10023191_099980 [Actinoallomurus oryzae]|uniref:Uncharacterized protein n=1 Tax=Actinoallomurus oryzae TaxID=502180 RepID=A0ABP8R8X9_9ACTN